MANPGRWFFVTGLMLGSSSVVQAQGPVDQVRVLGHYVQAHLAANKCQPPGESLRTRFEANFDIATGRAIEQMKLRHPGKTEEQVIAMIGQGRKELDKVISQTLVREGCGAPLIQEFLRRYQKLAEEKH